MARIEDVSVIWSSVSGVIEFLKDPKLGLTKERLDGVMAKLPEDHRKVFSSSHLAWDRVPLVAVNRLVEESAKAKGDPAELFAKKIGRYCAEHSPIMKTFAILMTPASTLKVAAQTWQKIYFGSGQMKADPTEWGARMTVNDFPAEAVGCARIGGWLEVVTEASGGKNVRVEHTQCLNRGASVCSWDVKWD